MRFSNLLQMSCVIGLMTGTLHAQLTPAQEREARESINKRIAEMEGKAPAAPAAPAAGLLPQAQQMLRDGRLGQSQYDKLEKQIRAYEAKPSAPELSKIQSQLATAAKKPVRETPAARIDPKERIVLHQQQRALQSNDPNAAYARDLERRVVEDMKKAQPAATAPQAAAPAPKPAPAPSAPVAPAPAKAAPPVVAKPQPVAPVVTKPQPAAPVAAAPKPAKPVAESKPKEVKKEPKAEKPVVKKPATVKAAAPSAPAAPAAPAGPKSKREKLADLLDQYKADKITPTQYQAERARILAEP